MAPLNAIPASERGTAVVEATAVIPLLIVCTGGLILAAYLLFARNWIEYQVEQSLYCLAEHRSLCRGRLETQVGHFLPGGTFQVRRLTGSVQDFQVEAIWRFQNIAFSFRKELSLKEAARKRDLRW
jgi:hypothetical protein